MTGLTRNRVSSTGGSRPITRNERRGTLCKACYHRVVTLKSSQFRTIPGIIDLTRLQKWTGASVGRCHVCDGDAIALQDPGDHFGMCETCYSQLCESEVRT